MSFLPLFLSISFSLYLFHSFSLFLLFLFIPFLFLSLPLYFSLPLYIRFFLFLSWAHAWCTCFGSKAKDDKESACRHDGDCFLSTSWNGQTAGITALLWMKRIGVQHFSLWIFHRYIQCEQQLNESCLGGLETNCDVWDFVYGKYLTEEIVNAFQYHNMGKSMLHECFCVNGSVLGKASYKVIMWPQAEWIHMNCDRLPL